MVKNFYITTPIFYPNANPHMGHAYTTLACDVLARYHRLAGYDTYFLTGTDEHTEKVIQAAKEHNQDPEKYLEDVVARFKNLYARLDISYDQFIRTSDQTVHWPGAIEMWKRLVAAGDIYKGEYSGLYCVGCEAFLTEKELIDGMCPNHNKVPERVTEENYFFRLSKYALKLEQIISSDAIRILPAARKNEALSFIKGGLEDVSFSRPKEKMSWGIPVPGDSSQTMYIWVDALSNYITALGFGRDNANIRFWPGMHVIGKDILRFHAIYWPAMLLSAHIALPHTILVHGLITSGGRKMSKTLGNVVDPLDIMKEYGTDALRYYLARHIHPFEDSDFTMEKFKEAYNANLVNGLGNLVARVMQMAAVYLKEPVEITTETQPDVSVSAHLESFEMNRAIDGIWERIGHGDALIALEKPFAKIKSVKEKERDDALIVIKKLVRELHAIATELAPFMPETSEKIKKAVLSHKKPENLFPRKE